jgi:hypothetical protein
LEKFKLLGWAIILGLLSHSGALAEPRWPLDIEISQSSSFAEFRGMRFHGGLDLRTKQTNGFPVYAIEDGFISRASVQFTGYGFGLYIDHPKLNARVVYGHLKCFNGPIQEYIADKLKAKGARHGINEFFKSDRFPVKKGQIVAYSGESGAGPSHLHFEIRNFNDDPIAPAKFGFRPKDNIFPSVYNLYIEPMEYGAVIDNSFLGKKYSLTKKTKALFYLPDSPTTSGKVGMQLGIADTNGMGNKYGIESINLSINGKKLIQRDFYQYSYDNTRECPLVFDYFKSNMTGTGYVINLFKYPFETLPFSKDYRPWSGVIDNNSYPGDSAPFEIYSYDYGSNGISVNGTLKKANYDFAKLMNFSNPPRSTNSFDPVSVQKIVTNFFETVVVCKTPKYISNVKKPDVIPYTQGCTEVKDSQGRIHLVPCIACSYYNTIELAFRNEPCWEGGAWIGNLQLLPKNFYVDSNGRNIAEGAVEVLFKKNTVHFPILASIENINDKPSDGGTKRDGYLKAYSGIWEFKPDNLIFDAEAVVRIKPNAYNGNLKKLGVYNVSDSGRYTHNGEEIEDSCLKFTTRSGGRYIVLEDLIPPAITYARHFTHYQLGNVYAFKCSDLGEGVSWLSGIATINGQKVETYADSDHKEVYVLIPKGIKLPHKVKLSVSDYAGNTGSITSTISK